MPVALNVPRAVLVAGACMPTPILVVLTLVLVLALGRRLPELLRYLVRGLRAFRDGLDV